MVKAKDFWNYLCDELEYRVFSGVPCLGFKSLYDNMDSSIMHYIPAVKEDVALGIMSGTAMSGWKAGVFLHIDDSYNILNWLEKFSLEYKVPLMVFIYKDKDNILLDRFISTNKINKVSLDDGFKKQLKTLNSKIEKTLIPGIVFIGKDLLL